jgi:hypothetical protein
MLAVIAAGYILFGIGLLVLRAQEAKAKRKSG